MNHVDAWSDWDGERRLWMPVGTSPHPMVIGLACLEPHVVVPIVTKQTRETLTRVAGLFDRVRFEPAVVVAPDDPAQIAAALRENATLRKPAHLLYGGGTTPMNVELAERWLVSSAAVRGARKWYLAERSSRLLSDDGLRVPTGSATRHVLGDVQALVQLAMPQWRLIPARSSKVPGKPTALPADPPIDALLRLLGGLKSQSSGELLEDVVEGLLLRILRQIPSPYPKVLSRNVELADRKLARTGANRSAEIDLTIFSSTRFTAVSCGVNTAQAPLSHKFHEARDRASFGGSEGRSLTVVHRSSLTDRSAYVTAMDNQRRQLRVNNRSERDRHHLVGIGELLPSWDRASAESLFQDPVEALGASPAGRRLLAFLRSCIITA